LALLILNLGLSDKIICFLSPEKVQTWVQLPYSESDSIERYNRGLTERFWRGKSIVVHTKKQRSCITENRTISPNKSEEQKIKWKIEEGKGKYWRSPKSSPDTLLFTCTFKLHDRIVSWDVQAERWHHTHVNKIVINKQINTHVVSRFQNLASNPEKKVGGKFPKLLQQSFDQRHQLDTQQCHARLYKGSQA
jgi:hypothetical protein